MLDKRRIGRVTGSRAGAILGLSPWQSPDDVLRAMVREYHGAESEFTGNVATEYGAYHEKGAIQDLTLEYGLNITDCGFYPYEDWLGATPDGHVEHDGNLEVKCPYGQRAKNPPEFKTLESQPHYFAQVQIEMFCSQRTKTYFWQWSPNGAVLEIVPVNKTWLSENLPKLKDFHELYLSELDNPEHLAPRLKIIESPAAQQLLDQYDDLSEQIELATEKKKEVMASLIDLAKEKNAEICGRKLTQVERKGGVDYKKVPELEGVDLEQYRRRPSKYWKLC